MTRSKRVAYGDLVSTLALTADGIAARPDDHTIYFAGEEPCDSEGRPLGDRLIADSQRRDLGGDVVVHYRFSQRPKTGHYADFHQKLTHYAEVLSAHARRIDPNATAAVFATVETTNDTGVFKYTDTATARAGIGVAASRLAELKVAIIGLGGTGSYLLDFLAKTHVSEIHLYDADHYLWHTAFRAPGPPPLSRTRTPLKVEHYAKSYGRMRRGIRAHPVNVDVTNVNDLRELDFVFVCVDDGPSRELIVSGLEAFGVPFVDVGIGVYEVEGALGGVIRTVTSTPAMRERIQAKHRLPFGKPDPHNEYARNIQVAELNALNAVFAVIRFKKHFGFYADLEHEHFSLYTIGSNTIINEDHPEVA